MGIFDRAREALGQAAAAVSKGAEDLSLQAQLGSLDSELERQFVEIGKRARELSRAGALQDQQIEILVRRVVQLEEQMMELRRQAAGQPSGGTPPPPPPASTP